MANTEYPALPAHTKSGAIFLPDSFKALSRRDIQTLKDLANESGNNRFRYCLHAGPSDTLQQMVLAMGRDLYLPPHRQVGRDKSYTLIEGEMQVVLFTESGDVSHVFEMGHSSALDKPFIVRFDSGLWHTVFPLTPQVVYQELLIGTFMGTEYAEWSPQTPAMIARQQEQIAQWLGRQGAG
ncbi:MAG: cupin fold metalloprotein, WbuC family [Magnetococcales bacterium]|nr:cupin fold metalloprotein, WbuC family [Magnetococcales bacterium]